MAISGDTAARPASASKATNKEQCNRCRFWLAEPDEASDCKIDGPGWGWCRREPPRVSDHLARIAIGYPSFDRQAAPEEFATVVCVADASLFPATFLDKWCGRFEPCRQAEGC